MRRLLTCFIILSSVATSACSSLLYQPSTELRDDIRASVPIQPLDVSFVSRDGTKLHAWYFKQNKTPPKGRIVFFHGNAENISTHFTSLYWILEEGYDYLIFDYRGYGLSQGVPSPRGTIADGIAAMCWAAQQKPTVPLIIFGQSLGGTVALSTLAETRGSIPVSAIIVDSTFHSYISMARSVLASHWLTRPLQPLADVLFSDRYAPINSMNRLPKAPLLVIHGTEDRIVNFSLGEKLYEQAKQPKTFLKIEGGHHMDAMWREQGKYRKTVVHHINQAVTESWALNAAQQAALDEYCQPKKSTTPKK